MQGHNIPLLFVGNASETYASVCWCLTTWSSLTNKVEGTLCRAKGCKS